MMQVLWLDRAEKDLDEAFDYLLARSPRAALRIYVAIRDGVAQLANYPSLGRPGRVAETRELVIAGTPYVIAYTVDQRVEAVIVLRVLHGARRWPDELKPPGPNNAG
ncbi:MAG TPA: type II toxin-antitoxin system RelE/ParE family toxin [Chloroflexota bacterium]|nr:type II toxin-antitoxin system RelE/ParE family toxin [Chloroflexota bacterium]